MTAKKKASRSRKWSPERRERWNAYIRERETKARAEKKAAGVCVRGACGQPVAEGRSTCLCPEHLEDYRQYSLRERRRRASLGLCTGCGRRRQPKGYKTCKKCRDEMAERRAQA